MKAPFPYFGGKRAVAPAVWERLGDCPNYCEPFAGSLAVLLSRPHKITTQTETVNDADGLLSNFWRSVKLFPDDVAEAADWIVSECDLHARHAWLCGHRDDITRRLEGDPDWCDPKAAGWWVWGICSWIGSGWCAEHAGPWRVVDGELLNVGGGQKRQLPHLGNAGRGINRQLPHPGDAGMGINRQIPDEVNAEIGACEQWSLHLRGMMRELQDRLRRVRVCCGDWERVCGDSPTIKNGITGVFLDPPYALEAGRDSDIYAKDSLSVAHAVREWALERGDNPMFRIALAGYEGEHAMPDSWECFAWKARGGYGSQNTGEENMNRHKERIWFSPHCLSKRAPTQESLFDFAA